MEQIFSCKHRPHLGRTPYWEKLTGSCKNCLPLQIWHKNMKVYQYTANERKSLFLLFYCLYICLIWKTSIHLLLGWQRVVQSLTDSTGIWSRDLLNHRPTPTTWPNSFLNKLIHMKNHLKFPYVYPQSIQLIFFLQWLEIVTVKILKYWDRLVWSHSLDSGKTASEEEIRSGSALFVISSASFRVIPIIGYLCHYCRCTHCCLACKT